MLVARGRTTAEQVASAVLEQNETPSRRLGAILLARGAISERDLAETLSEEFEIPLVDLAVTLPQPDALRLVRPSTMREHRVLPIELCGDHLVVAVCDPLDMDAMSAVERDAGRPARQVIAVGTPLDAAIAAFAPG